MKAKNCATILPLLVIMALAMGAEDAGGYYRNKDHDNESSSTTTDHRQWNLSDFPPLAHAEECRTPVSGRGCDPDKVFSDGDWQAIDQGLATTDPSIVRVSCDKNKNDDESAAMVQFAVAITRKVS